MRTEKKSQKFVFIVLTTFLVLFLSLLFWKIILANSPDSPDGATQGINIGVCVDPPSPDLTNPSQPIFRWSTSGNPQVKYWLKVDDSGASFPSAEVDTGKLDFSSSFYLLDLRRLSFNTTYNWRLKVWDTIGPDPSAWVIGPSFVTPKHQGPAVDFDWSPGLLMPDDTVRIQFFDRSVVFGGATKSAWFWTFENGVPATSIQQNPSVSFASSVTQSDVTLRVTDSDGYACTAGKTVDIIGLRTKLKEVIPR